MATGIRVEPEVTTPHLLCTPEGRLNRTAVGWSRSPLHTCNLPPGLPRKKRWNYWCVTSDDVLFSATIADVDIISLAFVYIYDLRTQRFIEQTAGAAPGIAMPATPAGDIVFEHAGGRVALTDEGAGTRIRVDWADFGGASLAADIVVARPPGHETLNVVIPWSDELFQFTSKQNTLPATGRITFGDDTYDLRDGAWGCLDYGRGVWPHETQWNWGAASGVQDGHIIGLNLGGGWTDGTGMTENGVCVDGRLTKIGEDLRFTWDRADRMTPWLIRTDGSERIDLRFDPVYERIAKTETDVFRSEVHQMFGHYSGRIVPDGGPPIVIDRLFGWIEEQDARW